MPMKITKWKRVADGKKVFCKIVNEVKTHRAVELEEDEEDKHLGLMRNN